MTGTKEKRVKMAAGLLFIFLFIAYMINADRVFAFLNGGAYVLKLPDVFPLHAQGELPRHFLTLRMVKTKFREMVVLNGKIFDVANKNGKAKLRVFLRSSTALYEASGSRRSFKASAKEIAVNWFVATSGLDRGVYQIGLSLFDGAGERFAWTNNFFNKAAGGPLEYIARPVVLEPTKVSETLKFMIEKIHNENKEFLIQGWMVMDQAEMNNDNAYIVLSDPGAAARAFYAPLYSRLDIAAMYDDARAANSGFCIRVSHHDFAPGNHVVRVMVNSRRTGEVIESEQAETRNF